MFPFLGGGGRSDVRIHEWSWSCRFQNWLVGSGGEARQEQNDHMPPTTDVESKPPGEHFPLCFPERSEAANPEISAEQLVLAEKWERDLSHGKCSV